MKVFYKLSVFLVASFHFTISFFILVGSLLQFYYEWVKVLYLPSLIVVFLPSLTKVYCPLSSLERWLRKKYDPTTTYKYFWDYYLGKQIRLSKKLVVTVFSMLLIIALLGRI